MFTGIIEGLGIIKKIEPVSSGKRLGVSTDFILADAKIGESIAVNGVCLTAVTLSSNYFEADISPETIKTTIFSSIKVGDRINIERALKLSDRLSGHLVSGHVDGIGVIKERKNKGNAVIVSIMVEKHLSRYMVKKGSVAVDGISLTINNCDENDFDVSIIPHTAHLTTIGFKDIGSSVNIETDMIGKYIEKFTEPHLNKEIKKSNIDMAFLAKAGFL
ncbi:MAG: riboflavin synthase [Desulfobacterales bacterium]|nr:riboflavin synthase [Desulfobacterales bacterium]MBF0398238.1 riboflavin synthase [Desulfobacterales bacterium]